MGQAETQVTPKTLRRDKSEKAPWPQSARQAGNDKRWND